MSLNTEADMDLHPPQLTLNHTPTRHQDCCLSLSSKLLDTLTHIFTAGTATEPYSVLSVGSGSGLLEAALLAHSPQLTIEGVEVQQPLSQAPVNKYLPEHFYHTVRGTRDVSPRLGDGDVSGVMFVCPRQPALVSRYIGALDGVGSSVRSVVWLGPVADWEDFHQCFESRSPAFALDIRNGEDVGLEGYEMMAILHK